MDVSIEKRQAYSEVYEFINLLDCEYINRIPKKLMSFFEREKDNNYVKNISPYEDIKNQNLKKDSIVILSMLNLKYWSNDEKKQRLNALYNENERKYQEELREKYNPDKIFENSKNVVVNQPVNQEIIVRDTEKSLVIGKKQNIFSKIIKFIRNIFSKNKKGQI